MNKIEIGKLFSAFGKLIEKMTDDEFIKLMNGEIGLTLEGRNKTKNMKSKKKDEAKVEDIVNVIEKLKESDTREKAKEILLNQFPITKINLMKLAKFLEIHVIKDDKTDTIINKIIEFLIGSKLKKDAIRQLDFGNSN